MAEGSLKDKTVIGVSWSAAETIVRYGITFLVSVILARLLTPDEYGLIGILNIFIMLFNIIIDGGFANALIRKKNAQEIDYNTAFYTNLVVSILMAGVFFTCSGAIADFFKRQELESLSKVMSLIVIVNALGLVQRVRLTKRIDFKTQTIISFLSAIVSGAVGVIMAYNGCGVWSLVGQQMSNSVVTAFFLFFFNRWIPKLQFSKDSFKEMWSFGWKLTMSGILNSLSTQIYGVVIGKFFSPATLGQYSKAHEFGNLPSNTFTTIIQRVTFPVLSELQDDPVKLKSAYKRVIKTTVLPVFIMMMVLAAVSKSLIVTLIGEKWIEASYFLQIMCFFMMLYPLNILNLNAIQVMGRSDLTLRVNIIKNILTIIPVTIGIFYGIYWMLMADVIKGYICYYLNAYYSGPLLKYPILEQIKDVLPAFGISLAISFPVYLISFIQISFFYILLIQVVIGLLIAFLILEITKIPEYVDIKGIAKMQLMKFERHNS